MKNLYNIKILYDKYNSKENYKLGYFLNLEVITNNFKNYISNIISNELLINDFMKLLNNCIINKIYEKFDELIIIFSFINQEFNKYFKTLYLNYLLTRYI